jgi:hypothetical protein
MLILFFMADHSIWLSGPGTFARRQGIYFLQHTHRCDNHVNHLQNKLEPRTLPRGRPVLSPGRPYPLAAALHLPPGGGLLFILDESCQAP